MAAVKTITGSGTFDYAPVGRIHYTVRPTARRITARWRAGAVYMSLPPRLETSMLLNALSEMTPAILRHRPTEAFYNIGDTVDTGDLKITISARAEHTGRVVARQLKAREFAVEVDPDAARACRRNVAASPWSDRVETVEADINDVAPGLGRFDAVICNPPYFKETLHAPGRQRSLARHGETFDLVRLLVLAPSLLTPDGTLSFIAPPNRHDDIMWQAALSRLNLLDSARLSHSPRKPPVRCLYTFTPAPATPAAPVDITVGDELYRRLTSPFYL